jgi:hypothetical protein
MNPLLQAVLDHRTDDARSIAVATPELLGELSEANMLPVEIAHASGDCATELAIRRASSLAAEGGLESLRRLLVDHLHALSHAFYCASWLDQWEFLVWDAMTTGASLCPADPEIMRPLSDGELTDLWWLAGACGGWATWRGKGVEFLPAAEWLDRFREWKLRSN